MSSVARALQKAFKGHASRAFLAFSEDHCSEQEWSWDNLRTRMFFPDGSHVTVDSDKSTFVVDSGSPL